MNEEASVLDNLMEDILAEFCEEARVKDVVSWLYDQGLLDYDTLKEVYIYGERDDA